MTIYQLKEIIHSKYNRNDVGRYHRAVLFLVENTVSGESSLFQINRINKNTCSLRCNNRKCNHRLSLLHSLPTEKTGKQVFSFATSVTKEDLMNKENWLKCFHDHTAKCTKTGPIYCDKTEHNFRTCASKSKLPEILSDLGMSNTSEYVMDSIPEDFLYLPDLFC